MYIKFSSPEDIARFVKISSAFGFDVDLRQGKYCVDGKSILGILSLDTSSPIEVITRTNDRSGIYPFSLAIREFEEKR